MTKVIFGIIMQYDINKIDLISIMNDFEKKLFLINSLKYHWEKKSFVFLIFLISAPQRVSMKPPKYHVFEII